MTTPTNSPAALEASPTENGQPTPTQTSGATTDPAAKPDVGPDVPKRKIKVNGAEREVSIEELEREYQRTGGGASNQWRQLQQRAADAERRATERETALKERTADVLAELGIDPRQFAETYLGGVLQRELADPKDRELADAREQLARVEAERAAERTAAQQREHEALSVQYAQEYEAKISKLLEGGLGGLPKTPETVQRVAYYLHEALQQGQDLEPEDVLPLVREDYENAIKSLIAPLDGAGVVALLGEETAEKIRRWDVGRLTTSPPPPTTTTPPPAQTPRQGMSRLEWQEHIRRRTG